MRDEDILHGEEFCQHSSRQHICRLHFLTCHNARFTVLNGEAAFQEQAFYAPSRKKTEMGPVEESMVGILPSFPEELENHRIVPHVRNAAHDDPLWYEKGADGTKNCAGVDGMFKHIGENDTIERGGREWQRHLLDVADYHRIQHGARLCGYNGIYLHARNMTVRMLCLKK